AATMIAAPSYPHYTAAHFPALAVSQLFSVSLCLCGNPAFLQRPGSSCGEIKTVPPPRVFLCKSVDLLENKGVAIFDKHKERKEFVIE
ncbi:MAG TPA: hypothetical protein VFR42_13085, partial [Candidatus Acidoferrum sp.]|nr:hypothetical protein [Candidatus Acidoferrum sp.]